MKRPLIHIASQVFDTPLAILPDKLETILRAVGPRLVPDAAAMQQLIDAGLIGIGNSRPNQNYAWQDDEDESYETRSSDKLYTLTNSGIAIIPISGTLMESGSWMSALSGCSSYDGIRKATTKAMDEDGAVRAILFKVNSPGGSTHGCFELTDFIRSQRGKKPMWAIAKHQACSAAYALASAADRVFLTMTAGVGSVGVFCLHQDVESADEKMGVKYTYIHYGDKKVEGNPHEKLSKSARADMQAEVDRQGDMFVERVAQNRGVSVESVKETQAGVLFADGAIPLFADEIASFDMVVEKLSGKLDSRSGRLSVGSRSTAEPIEKEATSPMSTDNLNLNLSLKAKRDKLQAELAAADAELSTVTPAPAPAPSPVPALSSSIPAASITGAQIKADTDPPPGPPDGDGDGGEKKDDPPPAEGKSGTNPDDCDMDDNEDDGDGAKKSKKDAKKGNTKMSTSTSNSAIKLTAEDMFEINYLGGLAGMPELAAEAITKQTPLAEFRTLLQDKRAALSAESSVSSSFTSPFKAEGLDAVIKQAAVVSANSAGRLSPSQALEAALRSNPVLYENFEEDRAVAIANPSPKAKRAYIAALQQRFSSLGLSSTVPTMMNSTIRING